MNMILETAAKLTTIVKGMYISIYNDSKYTYCYCLYTDVICLLLVEVLVCDSAYAIDFHSQALSFSRSSKILPVQPAKKNLLLAM